MYFEIGDRVRITRVDDRIQGCGLSVGDLGTVEHLYRYSDPLLCEITTKASVDFDKLKGSSDITSMVYVETEFLEKVEEDVPLEEVKSEIPQLQRIKKFLFVEDGSVDVDALQEILEDRNPDILLVVYRQGSRPPILVDAKGD